MTTSTAYARDATAALHKVLRIAPGDFDADGAAAVIEKAIRHATRERESLSRRQLNEVKAAAHERLARLLSSSPAVVYSFKASGDFAPTFVSDNIATVFGYTPAEYLENPSFWRDRVHPDDCSGRGSDYQIFSRRDSIRRVPLPPPRRLVLLGERCAASSARQRR